MKILPRASTEERKEGLSYPFQVLNDIQLECEDAGYLCNSDIVQEVLFALERRGVILATPPLASSITFNPEIDEEILVKNYNSAIWYARTFIGRFDKYYMCLEDGNATAWDCAKPLIITPNPWIEHDGTHWPDCTAQEKIQVMYHSDEIDNKTAPAREFHWIWATPENPVTYDIIKWRKEIL